MIMTYQETIYSKMLKAKGKDYQVRDLSKAYNKVTLQLPLFLRQTHV